ncbi:MAG: efflux RND transporter permease subunit [Pirellulales bacterium]|nr:efflux RND transporter permease subunit [Pirellulales bacterium]
MKSIVAWAIRNTPAMNTIMVGLLVVGAFSLLNLRREVFPEFDIEYIVVTVPYPGAAPAEVEEGICQKVEEAVRSIDGVKKIESTAAEGSGVVVLELVSDIPDLQRALNEVRSEVDRIPSFPELAEDPIVEQITLRDTAIRVGVLGPDDDSPEAELKLRDLAERVREELLLLPSISQVKLLGVRDYQIDIEISEDTLRKYGLSLQDVAALVRRQNIELPGGTMRTESQEVLLRGKSKGLIGTEIAKIPLITQPNGVVLTVGDLGTVRDQFADTTAINRINGHPAMVIVVEKVGNEDLLQITEEVREFVDKVNKPGGFQTPKGYTLEKWADISLIVSDRLELLGRNGLQGLVLVFVILALFLELRLAFWVALGIPVAILGACAILLGTGDTLNMITMFAFLTALGILVDDAIVVGENIYAHRQSGKSGVQAAIDGTCEVMPSVMASVMTTIIAFTPLMFVPGILGKFLAVMPFAVIVMLIISLIESTLILPCHLAHGRGPGEKGGKPGRIGRMYRYSQRGVFLILWTSIGMALWVAAVMLLPKYSDSTGEMLGISATILLLVLMPHLAFILKRLSDFFGWANRHVSRLLHGFIGRLYLPFLDWSINHRAIVLASAATTLLLAGALYKSGILPFNAFPKLDGDTIMATVVYPDGTPAAVAEKATVQCEKAIRKLCDEYSEPGKPLVKLVHRSIGQATIAGNDAPGLQAAGSNIGSVGVELVPAAERNVNSNDLVNIWRDEAGEFPGAESVSFKTPTMGPPGEAIEFTLMSTPKHMSEMEEVAEKCKAELAKMPGVFDITDDSRPGKWEFQVKVKDEAKALGNTVADLAETVRASYYGQEVMRLQRGRHEVKLMVRYPLEERNSLANFDNIRVRTPTAATRRGGNFEHLRKGATAMPERPLSELADVDVQRGFSTIHRLDQLRSLKVTADINEKLTNARKVTELMKTKIVPKILADYPAVKVHWGGREEDTNESVGGLFIGLMMALVAMFGLLTYQFKSYLQPILIMLIIPFGAIGAIVGHLVMGLELTLFSLFGLVALTGVVVNDSIVLIDFINHRIAAGMPLREALLDTGRRRFRPVLLTSLTTIGGLLPILLEKSMQAQVLIPMAVSLCFGLVFATVMVLVMVPAMYSVYYQLTTPKAERATWSEAPDGAFDDGSFDDLTGENLAAEIAALNAEGPDLTEKSQAGMSG